MKILAIGILVFTLGHFWKRLMPQLYARAGKSGKGISGALIAAGLVAMIVGYSITPFITVYDPPVWGAHLNWVLMFIAVGLLGAGHSKGRIRTWFRHPMLMSVIVWAIAHLLANGDLASVTLFAALGLWAIAQIFVVNASTGPWKRPEPGPVLRDFVLLGITIAAYVIFVGLHSLLGVNPFAALGS